jgi:hypothetical protein
MRKKASPMLGFSGLSRTSSGGKRRQEVILDTDDLYRRLPYIAVNDDSSVNSVAYKENSKPANEVSVDLARLLSSPLESLIRAWRPAFGVGRLSAGSARSSSIGFTVTHDPEPWNDAHSLMKGKNTKVVCRLLAERTQLIVPPRKSLPWHYAVIFGAKASLSILFRTADRIPRALSGR